MSPSEPRATVTQQAIEWHQRLDQGEMDAAARREFRAWMRSPGHAEELARICMVDALIQRREGKREPRRTLPKNVINFDAYAPASRARSSQQPPIERAAPRSTNKIAIAASLVLALLVVAMVGLMTTNRVIVTRQGHWDKQLLEDGTVVHAGPRTRLRFNFDDDSRDVTLVHGEAFFEVAKDPDRPFIVTTDRGRVQAIGTAFATRDLGGEVVVIVASGRVAVTSSAAGVQPTVPLGANQQTVLSPSGASEPVSVNAEREVKWIRNWYEYDGERVGEIIEQLNRRHDSKVVIDDPQVARLRMSSLAFKPSEPEAFVAKINRWYAEFPQKAGRQRGGDALRLERP